MEEFMRRAPYHLNNNRYGFTPVVRKIKLSFLTVTEGKNVMKRMIENIK